MSDEKNRGENSYDMAGVFSLLKELQQTLYLIARNAELRDPELLAEIQKEAEIGLRFVDSFLHTLRLDSGQISLDLSPVGLGSLLHEVAYEVKSVSGSEVGVYSGAKDPVMTNNHLIKSLLFSIGYFMSKTTNSELKFTTFKSAKNKVGIGVLAKNFEISANDLRQAISNNYANMPMARQTQQSPVMLIVASSIARALGTDLNVKKLGKSKGFSVSLIKSQQLSFV